MMAIVGESTGKKTFLGLNIQGKNSLTRSFSLAPSS